MGNNQGQDDQGDDTDSGRSTAMEGVESDEENKTSRGQVSQDVKMGDAEQPPPARPDFLRQSTLPASHGQQNAQTENVPVTPRAGQDVEMGNAEQSQSESLALVRQRAQPADHAPTDRGSERAVFFRQSTLPASHGSGRPDFLRQSTLPASHGRNRKDNSMSSDTSRRRSKGTEVTSLSGQKKLVDFFPLDNSFDKSGPPLRKEGSAQTSYERIPASESKEPSGPSSIEEPGAWAVVRAPPAQSKSQDEERHSENWGVIRSGSTEENEFDEHSFDPDDPRLNDQKAEVGGVRLPPPPVFQRPGRPGDREELIRPTGLVYSYVYREFYGAGVFFLNCLIATLLHTSNKAGTGFYDPVEDLQAALGRFAAKIKSGEVGKRPPVNREHIDALLERHGYPLLETALTTTRPEAIRFYEHMGFYRVATGYISALQELAAEFWKFGTALKEVRDRVNRNTIAELQSVLCGHVRNAARYTAVRGCHPLAFQLLMSGVPGEFLISTLKSVYPEDGHTYYEAQPHRRPPALIIAILMKFGLLDHFKYAVPVPNADVPGREAARMGPCLHAYYATDNARKTAELIGVTNGKVVYRGVSNEMRIEHDDMKGDGNGHFTWMGGPKMAVVLVLSNSHGYDIRYTGLPQALRDGFSATATMTLDDRLFERVAQWTNLKASVVGKVEPNPFDQKFVTITAPALMFVFQVYLP